ncbi:MAG: hypothetical protein ABI605_15415 [Rhizobacter sp.]
MKPWDVNWSALFEKLLDPYDVKARLFPGLLVLVPAIAFLVLLYGPQSPAIIGLAAVLSSCGGPYLLASFVRTWGQHAQDRLFQKWGAQPSTMLLRHRDNMLSLQTKLRYHKLVESRLAVALPTAEEEQRSPCAADAAYAAAGDALRPFTNDRKAYPFVFKELVAYGFNRNAYGARWVGLLVTVLTVLASVLHAGALRLSPITVDLATLDNPHIMVIVLALGMAGLWCLHFTSATVRMAGFSYAKRLWEALETLQRRPSRAQKFAS